MALLALAWMKPRNHSGSVCDDWSCSTTSATVNSFHDCRKAYTPDATRPGASRGKVIRRNAWVRLSPSTIAASSRSAGMPATKPRSIQIVNGTTDAMYRMLMPTTEFSRFTDDISLYCAMNRPSAGSICTNRIASTNPVRPRKRKRLIATAARNANSRQTATTSSAITTLMPSAGRNEPPWNTLAKLSKLPPSGTKLGAFEVSTKFDSSDEFSIQYTGKNHTSATTTPTIDKTTLLVE